MVFVIDKTLNIHLLKSFSIIFVLCNWSNNVVYEFNKVFERKRTTFDDLICDLIIELTNKNTFLSKQHFITFSIGLNLEDFNPNSLKKLLTDFWRESNLKSHEFPSEIISALNSYKRSFIKNLLNDKKVCFKKMSAPHIRKQKYPHIEQRLNIDGKDDLNNLGNDMNICLDAHDLGKNVHKLQFHN